MTDELEGREGVKWELGFAFFRDWEMGFCALGLGFMKKKNNRKMGMGFQFKQHRLGLWDLSWDFKKTISWEMGLGPPLHDPRVNYHAQQLQQELTRMEQNKPRNGR